MTDEQLQAVIDAAEQFEVADAAHAAACKSGNTITNWSRTYYPYRRAMDRYAELVTTETVKVLARELLSRRKAEAMS